MTPASRRPSRFLPRHLPRIPLPIPGTVLIALAAVYVLFGLAGHAPWKSEDAIGIGLVHQMLDGAGLDNWLVPRLAGERYLEDGPIYYALAAVCAKLFSFILLEHDGARLASAISIGAALWATHAAARRMNGRMEADSTVLILIGCLGLFVHAHEVMAENGALAGAALAWLGLAWAGRDPDASLRAGLTCGAGLAIAWWCKGPATAMPVIVALLAAPLLGSAWRTRAWGRFAAMSLAILLVAALLWFAALHVDQAGLPAAWWEARERTLATPTGERALEQLQLLSWATWPAWPLALWVLWDRRRRLANDPLLPVAAGALTALVLFVLARNVSEVTAMPMFLPLALMGGAGVPALRRGAANGMAWFGAMTFTLLAGLVWLGWVAMMTGVPRQIALNFAKLEPGFVPQFNIAALIFGLFLTLAWVVWLMPTGRSPQKSVAFWAGGITLLWCLAMTLWLPWIDYGKTYRPVSLSLAAALKKADLPPRSCIASRGLGEAQRAVFDYHANIVTRRLEVFPQASCPALLVQSTAGAPDRNGPGWRRIWEGNRPRDRERYRLYVRE